MSSPAGKASRQGACRHHENYMANKSFSRGVETLGAEASMVFGREYPAQCSIHAEAYRPVWRSFPRNITIPPSSTDCTPMFQAGEIDVIRGEMFASGYDLWSITRREILRHMRNDDYPIATRPQSSRSSDISTRDRDGVNKTFSGMMKLLFPADNATEAEVEEILHLAAEGRKRVKDQLLRIDSTYPETDFIHGSRRPQGGRQDARRN